MAKKKKTTKAKTTKKLRTIACKHLKNIDEISNARKPLCYCTARGFNLSPYNYICQICKQYVENSSQLELKELYHATEAKDFQFDENDIDFPDADFIIEEEVEKKKKKKKSKKSKKKSKIEEDDDDFEIEKVTEEEEEVVVIGHEKEEKEEPVDYEDESEEGLGKKHGSVKGANEEEEDEDFEDEIEDFDEKNDQADGSDEESSIDFEAEVIKKIKKIGKGENVKEICPFCQRSKVSVLRHLPKCKRCPPEVISAYKIYKKKKKK